MIEIRQWGRGKVIHSGNFDSVKDCLEDGVKKGISFAYADLSHADLSVADLSHADLRCTKLRKANLMNAYLMGASGIKLALGLGKHKRQVFCVDHGDKIMIKAGPFWGDEYEFAKALEEE